MLQQTQVKTVLPYYKRFLRRFPTLKQLAQAPLSEVLVLWAGLGYYSRAKHLHAAAQQVMARLRGKLPSEVAELMKLPGVGRYTAGAISSIAFSRPAPILDGNVIRVLSRYFGIRGGTATPVSQRRLWNLAEEILPAAHPGAFNQALMDLGALICLRRSPQCAACPLASNCVARAKGQQEKIPPARPVPKRKKIRYLCGIVERNGSVLLARRPAAGLLPGLWEFPGGEQGPEESQLVGLRRLLRERLAIRMRTGKACGKITQLLTHRELEIQAFHVRVAGGSIRPCWYTKVRWMPKARLRSVPFTAGMKRVAQLL